MVYINIQGRTWAIHARFMAYHVPNLYVACHFATNDKKVASPKILQGVDPNVFGLLQNWIYSTPHSTGLTSQYGEPAYQDRLTKLWILAKQLALPQLQNDAIDALEARQELEGNIHTKLLEYIYEKTLKGDTLRKYMMHKCARSIASFSKDVVEERFPIELVREIEEAKALKIEEEEANAMELDITGYHVRLDS